MSATWKYLLARLGLLVVTFAVLWPTGLDPLVIAMAAVLISFILSFVLLRRWRTEMMHNADTAFTRRREEKAQLRSALAGDDEVDADSDTTTARDDQPAEAESDAQAHGMERDKS